MINETAIVVQETACPVCATPPTVLYRFFFGNFANAFTWSENMHMVCVSSGTMTKLVSFIMVKLGYVFLCTEKRFLGVVVV